MAWGARWGLKQLSTVSNVAFAARLNGLGSPLGIETIPIGLMERP